MNIRTTLWLCAVLGVVVWWVYPTVMSPNPSGVLADVKVPVLSKAGQAGKQSFDDYCSACHGENAAGRDGKGPPLVHKLYEKNHHGDSAFYSAANIGVRAHHWPFGNMPPVANISQDELTAIIGYVRELQRANGIN